MAKPVSPRSEAKIPGIPTFSVSIKLTLLHRGLEGIQGLADNLSIIAVGGLSWEESSRMQSLV